jgi:hypothetical protein
MTPPPYWPWFLGQVHGHARRFLRPEAAAALESTRILPVTSDTARDLRGPCIGLPIDVEVPVQQPAAWRVPFGRGSLTPWGVVPSPGAGWTPWPSAGSPLWHRHPSGSLVPAWNLYGNAVSLLTLAEERRPGTRDRHGRFIGAMCARGTEGLLEVPAFNEAVAALVAAALGLRDGGAPAPGLDGVVLPPVVALSHDNDLLRGNDAWTQGVRAFRMLNPMLRGRPPRLGNAWWIARNAVAPRAFYFDNVGGMIDVERMLGFRSTFYLLNGRGGRFGARSGTGLFAELMAALPRGWPTGMHYNYDTLLDDRGWQAQRRDLEALTGRPVESGRGHYLRFDPVRSFEFLDAQGIRCDETVGWPDRVGYRCGIAGPFQPFLDGRQAAGRLWEMPLVVMDSALLEQYPDDPTEAFRRLLDHLSVVGGALSLLFHPGMFHNPEFPETAGLYRRLLGVVRDVGASGGPALSLLPPE